MDQASAGPSRVWQVGKYRFERYSAGRWDCSDGMLGSGGRTPIGAFISQVRWKREYRSKPPASPGVTKRGEAMNPPDADFLTWLADRLENVYHESPNVDFVRRLRTMAERMMEMRLTPKDALIIERDSDGKFPEWITDVDGPVWFQCGGTDDLLEDIAAAIAKRGQP